MGKVFRLHDTGSNNIQDWGDTQQYGQNEVNKIPDPNGSQMGMKVTSIPSPFAMIDLVKTAFAEVVKSNDLDGTTEYHRIVSDAMDVAEIFFNYNKLQNDIEIIECRKEDIGSMGGAIGDTLRMFMEQDAGAYNFNDFDAFYLLNYKRGPKPMNIIGATSPATLFFAPANDLSYASAEIKFANGDFPFDTELQPLYKRDPELIKLLWLMMKQKVNGKSLSQMMPEVNAYIEATYTKLDGDVRQMLNEAAATPDLSVFDALQFDSNNVDILKGLTMRTRPEKPLNGESDFEIKSTIYTGEKKPLVLPSKAGTIYEGMTYTPSNLWGKNDKAPETDERPLSERTLPNEGTKHPYLTIGDFLEDRIVMSEDEDSINSGFYFDGNINAEKHPTKAENLYLLPIKRQLFEFFTAEEVVDMFDMQAIPGNGAKVTLSIPVKGVRGGKSVSIKYERIYHEDEIDNFDFTFAMMPAIRFEKEDEAKYRIAIAPLVNYEPTDVELHFFNSKAEEIPCDCYKRNSDKSDTTIRSYAVEGKNISFIEVKHDEQRGIILPILKKQNTNSTQFSFAIDLGTSNTHIEYTTNAQDIASKPLDITEQDIQLAFLASNPLEFHKQGYLHCIKEYIPDLIGNEAMSAFPLRTALTEAKSINWDSPVAPFTLANAQLTYDRLIDYKDSETKLDIKWANDSYSSKRIKAYIDSLFFLIRNKVVIAGGDLKNTKITWFYPISMIRANVNKFEATWIKSYETYFGGDVEKNVTKMTESVAPYEYSKAKFGMSSIATIDIGGGTTDVVLANNGKIEAISSFRLAVNNIFGNGYEKGAVADENNNITSLFKDDIARVLAETGVSRELKEMLEQRRGADLASFMFSLASNKEVKEKKAEELVDFNRMLAADERTKIVFLLFYFSIIYHIANIIKLKGLTLPEKIVFSGNGSKVLSIITPEPELLSDLTKTVFEAVCNLKYMDTELKLIYGKANPNPKEMTCKGGILCKEAGSFGAMNALKVVVKGDNSGIVEDTDTYANVSEELKRGVISENKKMLELFFAIGEGSKLNFNKNFGVDTESLAIAKQVCYKDLKNGLENGINKWHEDGVIMTDKREETLFFYPLIEVLYRLSSAICEVKQNSQN